MSYQPDPVPNPRERISAEGIRELLLIFRQRIFGKPVKPLADKPAEASQAPTWPEADAQA